MTYGVHVYEIDKLLRAIDLLPQSAAMRHAIEDISRADQSGVPRYLIVRALSTTRFKCSPTELSTHLYVHKKKRERILKTAAQQHVSESSEPCES